LSLLLLLLLLSAVVKIIAGHLPKWPKGELFIYLRGRYFFSTFMQSNFSCCFIQQQLLHATKVLIYALDNFQVSGALKNVVNIYLQTYAHLSGKRIIFSSLPYDKTIHKIGYDKQYKLAVIANSLCMHRVSSSRAVSTSVLRPSFSLSYFHFDK